MYLLDVNFFIQANQVDYPLISAPTFWRYMQQLAAGGTIVSLDKVYTALDSHDKELKTWCDSNLPQSFFQSSIGLIESYKKVITWSLSQQDHYLPFAINEFLSAQETGAWLVAYSLQYKATIVTYERDEPEKRHCITIPEACGAFGVPYLHPADMFEQLGLII